MSEAEVTMVPQTWATLTNEDDIKKMNRILDLLDEDDDVQNVYHNWDFRIAFFQGRTESALFLYHRQHGPGFRSGRCC